MKELNYIVHDESNIKGFYGAYRFLSNFYMTPVEFEGITYPSAESAYMAAKSIDPEVRERFRVTTNPKDARKLGRSIKLREGWDEMRLEVMESLLRSKFSNNKYIRAKLLDTGDKYLEETNHWNDRFWGVCKGIGENNLGKLLMKIRDELRNS